MYSRKLLRDILEWDVQSWKQSVFFWDRFTADITGASSRRRCTRQRMAHNIWRGTASSAIRNTTLRA